MLFSLEKLSNLRFLRFFHDFNKMLYKSARYFHGLNIQITQICSVRRFSLWVGMISRRKACNAPERLKMRHRGICGFCRVSMYCFGGCMSCFSGTVLSGAHCGALWGVVRLAMSPGMSSRSARCTASRVDCRRCCRLCL